MVHPSFFAVGVIAYLALAAYSWPGREACCKPTLIGRLLPWPPLLLHLYVLYMDVLSGPGVALGFAVSLSAVGAMTVLVHSLAIWRYPLGGLEGFVLVFAAAVLGLHGLMRDASPIPHSEVPLFAAHLIVAFVAYSLFTIAALHALLMALAEKRLHRAVSSKMITGLPPLLSLEKLLFRLIEVGFVLLTLTLVTGILFAQEIFGRALPFSHMTLFGLTSWLIYGALLVGRRVYGWRGRTAIYWTLAGFAFLLLSYVGVKFVLEVFLGRT